MHDATLLSDAVYHNGAPHRLAKRREGGLTLIELIVTIAVLAIMLTVAVPGYQQFMARNEVATAVLKLKTALAMTRSAAVTRRTTVTLCPTVDMTQCQINNNAGGEAWLSTLAVYEGRGEPGDELLRSFGESDLSSLTYRNDDRPVRYKTLGRSAGYNGTFRICGRQDEGASVIVSNFGRVRVESERPEC